MSKLGPTCQYCVWPPLFSSTALTLLGMEFNRASQVATGVLFHFSITTSRSWWMLETLRSSTFHLRMPHSLPLTSASLARQWSLSCWNTALRPSLRSLRRGFLLGRQPCRLIWCSVRHMVRSLTGHPFNLCSNAGSTRTSISQTQHLDMTLSTSLVDHAEGCSERNLSC